MVLFHFPSLKVNIFLNLTIYFALWPAHNNLFACLPLYCNVLLCLDANSFFLVAGTPDISKMDEETRKMWVDSQGEIVMNDFEPKRRFHNHGVYPCDRCGRTYVRKDSLSRHLQWECGKEPQFQCPFCPQKCKRKSHQLRHIQRQHQDKMHLLTDRDNDLEDLIK
ncbi:hypothetical protein FOCC_FOCC005503 [Frankliniella occidentalis]|nr:hypothetical protein FOCC_FOCC005503 [Frankliniella occidentalis]